MEKLNGDLWHAEFAQRNLRGDLAHRSLRRDSYSYGWNVCNIAQNHRPAFFDFAETATKRPAMVLVVFVCLRGCVRRRAGRAAGLRARGRVVVVSVRFVLCVCVCVSVCLCAPVFFCPCLPTRARSRVV